MFRFDCHAAPQRAADFSSIRPSVASVALSRRACLGGGLAALALLAGCKPAAVPFKGIDLTGAQYGRDFRLRDADGRERTLADFKGQADKTATDANAAIASADSLAAFKPAFAKLAGDCKSCHETYRAPD